MILLLFPDLGKEPILKMDYFDHSFLFTSLFIIFDELMDTFLDCERIQGIEEDLLFIRKTTVWAYICVPLV